MKKVVTVEPASEISINKVDESKFYGVQDSKSAKSKGFIIRDSNATEGKRLYVTRDIHLMTSGNAYDKIARNTLREEIEALIEYEFFVFEFSSGRELFTWLAE